MGRFDRYLLYQLVVFFGFFALVLVAVFWINRSVRLFDRLIGNGQTTLVFLEFTTLGLPGLVLMVLPLASFAAAIYVTNRMANESELTVMLAAGSSPWRLARPVLLFALLIAVMTAILSHVLVPAALERLHIRETEVSKDVTARLLTEGTFLHPSAGVTLYTREIGSDGVLRDVFLSDRRDPAQRIIYTANTAYLVRDEARTTLIMINGLAQSFDAQTGRLSTATFQDFSHNISGLIDAEPRAARAVRAVPTYEMIGNWRALPAQTGQSLGVIVEEFHSRFAQSLFAMSTAMIGFAVMLGRGFSRFGAWREMLIAFALLMLLDGLRASITDPIRDTAALWPLAYLPAAVGAVIAASMLAYAARTRRKRGTALGSASA